MRVGKNKLATMVRGMCSECGISNKTNHSLRATGATTLFNASVPEKIIQSTTGHRSVDALRCYERVSDEQQQAKSRVLTARDPNVSFQVEMSKVKKEQAKYVEQSLLCLFFHFLSLYRYAVQNAILLLMH